MNISTYAQREFAPKGATWYYSKRENFAGEEGYIKIVSKQDTLIEGKLSKVLSQKYYSAYGDSAIRDNIYVHQNGDTVFYWVDNAFRILYNFSVTKDDTMVIYSRELMCKNNKSHLGKIKVDSVTNIKINGIDLKEIFSSRIAGSVYQYPGPFLELIGGINGIYPLDSGCSADVVPDIGKLRCYSDSSIGIYQASKKLPCDTLLRITDIQKNDNNSGIRVYYNFNSSSVDIILRDIYLNNHLYINIYDMMGNIVYGSKIDKTTNHLNLSRNLNGVYLIQIRNNEKIMYYEKILKY
jgi:hypothetical protein